MKLDIILNFSMKTFFFYVINFKNFFSVYSRRELSNCTKFFDKTLNGAKIIVVCMFIRLFVDRNALFFIKKWATPTFWRVYSEFNFKNNVNVQKIFGCLFAEIYVVKVFSYNKRLAVNSDSCLIFLVYCCIFVVRR